jgi:hypothetical protein
MKWILFILGSGFNVDISNGVHNVTLFNSLKDMSTLTSYISLNA